MSLRPQRARTTQPPRRRPGRRFGIGLLALTATAALAFAGSPSAQATQPAPHPASAAAPAAPLSVPAAPSGFTTTWADDFDGAAGSALDTGVWRYDTGAGSGFGTGEIETMTNSTSNVYHDGNGHLVLKALHSGSDPNSGWTSGRVETQADGFGALPGGVVRMQASIQQPDVSTANGAGYWPAFWMLGAPLRVGQTWPGSGEVDILEDINGRSSVFGTLHCGVSPGGSCNESTGVGSGERACSGCQSGYHTYAVELDRSTSPEQIRWYLDGQNYFTLSANQVDATTVGQRRRPQLLHHLRPGHGRRVPGRVRRRPERQHRLRRPAQRRLRRRVQQGPGRPPDRQPRAGQAHHGVLSGTGPVPGVQRHRRGHHHPLVERSSATRSGSRST